MTRTLTILAAALLALTVLAAPAAAQQPQTQSLELEEGEGEQTTETMSFAEEVAALGVAQDPNDPITRVNAAIHLGVAHRRIRDFGSLYAMVDSYSRLCYEDLDALSPDNDYIRARTICYLKNKGVFTKTYSEGINPFNGFDRDLAARYYARSGRYLGPLPSANGIWWTTASPGCEYYTDVSCSNTHNNDIGEVGLNMGTACQISPSKYCPGIRFTWGHSDAFVARIDDKLD